MAIDYIEHLVSTRIGAGLRHDQPLFNATECQYVHLRHRLGLTFAEISYVLDLDVADVKEMGTVAQMRLEDEIQSDVDEFADDDDDDDGDDEDPPDLVPVDA